MVELPHIIHIILILVSSLHRNVYILPLPVLNSRNTAKFLRLYIHMLQHYILHRAFRESVYLKGTGTALIVLLIPGAHIADLQVFTWGTPISLETDCASTFQCSGISPS